MKCGSLTCVVIVCITFLYIGKLILMEVSKYQGDPYMDEIFHIRQTQKYCVGHYSEVCLYVGLCMLYLCTVLLRLKIQPHKLWKLTKMAENNFPGTCQMALQKLKKTTNFEFK